MRKYLKRMTERYWGADRTRRGELLTAMEAITGLELRTLLFELTGAARRAVEDSSPRDPRVCVHVEPLLC